MTETYFDDALSGSDGTGRDGSFPDALAVEADEWSPFTLAELPVTPGGGIEAARALVEADSEPTPHTASRNPFAVSGAPEQQEGSDLRRAGAAPRPVRVPGGQWGRLQPAPSRR